MRQLISQWRRLDPPWYVLVLVLLAVFVLPGGIPLTVAFTPAYVAARRRARS